MLVFRTARSHKAYIQVVRGCLERCMTVPEVTEVWRPQSRHSQSGRQASRQALEPEQTGQRKPSGHRTFARKSTQESSSGKAVWNSRNVSGDWDELDMGASEFVSEIMQCHRDGNCPGLS